MTAFNRRQVLKSTSLSLLGMALATAMPNAAAAAPTGSGNPLFQPPRLTPGSRTHLTVTPTPYQPVSPMQITASHSLSSDAFVTSSVTVNLGDDPDVDGDQVVPITRADGRVEALILSRTTNAIWFLQRDSTAPGGWNYFSYYDNAPYTISSFTAAYHPVDGNVYILIRLNDPTWGDFLTVGYIDQNNGYNHASMTPFTDNNSTGGWWGYASSHSSPQHCYDISGNPFFYLWDDPLTYYTIDITVGSSPGATLVPHDVGEGIDPDSVLSRGRITLSDYGIAFTASSQYGMVLAYGGELDYGVSGLSWVGTAPTPQGSGFGFFSTDPTDGPAIYVIGSRFYANLAIGIPSSYTYASVASSVNATAGQVYFVVGSDGGDDQLTGQLWTMVTGTVNGSDNSVATPIDSGYAAVYAPSLLTQDVTFFAVAQNGDLTVLTRSPGSTASFYTQPLNGVAAPDNPADGAWRAVPVHQPAATATELSTWRTTIRVTDATGAVQVGLPLSVTADRDCTVWQPGGTDAAGQPLSASTYIPAAGTPATFTTDSNGQVTLAAPADALHTATYTVTTPDGTTATLAPDGPLHSMMTDTATLAVSMQNANAADGSALFKALPSTGDGTASQAATDAATFIAQAMSAGLGQPLPTQDAHIGLGSFALPGGPRLLLSAPPLQQVESISSWWAKAKHDVESAARGIEKGVVTIADDIKTAATVAVVDIKNGIVQITLAVTGAVEDTIDYIITDAKSAVTAITGVFHALLQDVTKGFDDILHWLREDVFGTLLDASDAADYMMVLLAGDENNTDSADSRFRALIQQWQNDVDRDFTEIRDDITAQFANVSTFLSGQTLNGMRSSVPTPTGSSPPGESVGDSKTRLLADVVHDVKALWLLDKIQLFPVKETTFTNKVTDAFDKLVLDIGEGFEELGQDFLTIAKDVATLVVDGVQSSVANSDLSIIFTNVGAFINDFFGLLQQVVDDLLDLLLAVWDTIIGTLTAPLDQLIPDAAPLFDLIGIGDFSAGKVLSMLITLPGTIFAKVRFGSEATMFSTADQVTVDLEADQVDWSAYLDTASLLATFFWGIVDGSVDVFRLAAQAEEQTYTPPAFVAWTDLSFSLFSTLVSYPFSSTKPLSFDPTPGTAKYPNLPTVTWFCDFGPALINFLALKLADGQSGDQQKVIGQVQTWLVSATGVALTVLNSITAWETVNSDNSDDVNAARAIAVVGNLTNAMSPLGLFADPTVGITDIVKVIFDIGCPVVEFGSELALLEKR